MTSEEKQHPGYVELQKATKIDRLSNGQVNQFINGGIENWFYFFHKMGDRRAVFKPQYFVMLVEWITQRRFLYEHEIPHQEQCRRIFPEPAPPYKDFDNNVFLPGLCKKEDES